MSRVELLNAGGLRLDSRRAHELRSLVLALSPASSSGATLESAPAGSARVQMGLASVFCAVYGPREARKTQGATHGEATLEIEVELEPWSGRERRRRQKGDRRLVELASSLKSTFEPVIHRHLFPRSEIVVQVVVEVQDGGTLSCAINAITLALLDAGVPMSDSVLSLTLGQHLRPSCVLLDLTSTEESGLPCLTLAMLPRTRKVTLAQSESRLGRDELREMLRLGEEAILVLQQEVDAVLKARTRRLVQAMGAAAKTAPMLDEPDMMQE